MAKGRSAKSDIGGLTPAQEKYCRARAAGMTQVEAYEKANKDSKALKSSKAVIACHTEKLEKVQKRLAELRAAAEAGAIADIRQIQADVAAIALDEDRPDGVRLKAYDQLTRMQGGYKDGLDVRASGTIGVDVRRSALADVLPPPEEQ